MSYNFLARRLRVEYDFRKQGVNEAPFQIFLAGDTMLVTPWSHVNDSETIDLFRAMRAAEVTIVNLETVIHSFEGHAQANSGGTWMRSPPEIAWELAWAGVDMVCHANNHAFDYGPEGIMQTIGHVEAAGIVLSGSGADLLQARAPRHLTRKGRTVAHLAMASTFVSYGKASRPRGGMRGRPGINPLAVGHGASVTLPPWAACMMKRLDQAMGRNVDRYRQPSFRRNGMNFSIGRSFSYRGGPAVNESDEKGNLQAIAEARANADIVVVSIHAHQQAGWFRQFAARAVEAGADVIVAHGPHSIRGIEIINGRPVFHGLGDFAYQADKVELQPSDAYDRFALGDEADVAQLRQAWSTISELSAKRETFEGLAARVRFSGREPVSIELLPIDLRFADKGGNRGLPRLADGNTGRRLIGQVAELSKPMGARIAYDPAGNRGSVALR